MNKIMSKIALVLVAMLVLCATLVLSAQTRLQGEDTVSAEAVYLASVKIGDSDVAVDYGTLEEAVTYANNYTDTTDDITITLLGNADISNVLVFSNTNNHINLDLYSFVIARSLDEAIEDGEVICISSDVNISIYSSADITGTITGGNSLNYSGGIINNGTASLDNIVISGNYVYSSGGGIYNNGILTITNSTITTNTSSGTAAGIYNAGEITATNSAISYNIASSQGGGINNNVGAKIILNNCDVIYNETSVVGAGIINYGEMVIENGSMISNNSAKSLDGTGSYGNGGGIYNYGGEITITESSVSSNTAEYRGAGIYNWSGSIEIIDSDVSSNVATLDGGGIINTATLTITGSTTVTDNTGYGISENIYLTSNALIIFDDFTGEVGVKLLTGEGNVTTTWSEVIGGTVTSDNTAYMEFVSDDGETMFIAEAAATVTIDGVIGYYASIEDAVTYANDYATDDNAIYITLLSDADTTSALEFTNTVNDITLDLAGCTIDRGLSSAVSYGYVIYVDDLVKTLQHQ